MLAASAAGSPSGKRVRKRATASSSPSILTSPPRSASFRGIPPRRGGVAAADRDGAVCHIDLEAVLAEAQRVGRTQVTGDLRVEHRPQGQDVGVDAHAGVLRAQRRAAAPAAELVQHRGELRPPVGELIHPGAERRGELAAPDDAGALEVAQTLREDVGAGVEDSLTQVGEALGAEQQLADHEHGPPLAHEIERVCRGTRFTVCALGRHAASLAS